METFNRHEAKRRLFRVGRGSVGESKGDRRCLKTGKTEIGMRASWIFAGGNALTITGGRWPDCAMPFRSERKGPFPIWSSRG